MPLARILPRGIVQWRAIAGEFAAAAFLSSTLLACSDSSERIAPPGP